MFGSKIFGEMRRAGMNVGLSKGKLSQAMLEILIQLPMGTTNLKETIVDNMGLLGQMSATRDINEAWNQTKKKAAKEYPEKFVLVDRGILHWNDGSTKVLDKKISTVNFQKLNDLADIENCSVNKLISKLIKSYERGKA
jgi:predicted AAA+ superfamily ATPase